MKQLILLAAALPVFAVATSILPVQEREVASSLTALDITTVERTGVVLKEDFYHPTTSYLIGINVEVNPRTACTDFVGQIESNPTERYSKITPYGAQDPVNTACIEILPAPIQTQLTFKMDVLTGGFVRPNPIQTSYVNLNGAGTYIVTLNMARNSVSILPAPLH